MSNFLVCPHCDVKASVFKNQELFCKNCHSSNYWDELIESKFSTIKKKEYLKIYATTDKETLLAEIYLNKGCFTIKTCQPSQIKEIIKFVILTFGVKVIVKQSIVDDHFANCPICATRVTYFPKAIGWPIRCQNEPNHFQMESISVYYASILKTQFPEIDVCSYSYHDGLTIRLKESPEYQVYIRARGADCVIVVPKTLKEVQGGEIFNFIKDNLLKGIRFVEVNG